MVEYIGVRESAESAARAASAASAAGQQQDGGWAFGGDGRRSRAARLSNEMRLWN